MADEKELHTEIVCPYCTEIMRFSRYNNAVPLLHHHYECEYCGSVNQIKMTNTGIYYARIVHKTGCQNGSCQND